MNLTLWSLIIKKVLGPLVALVVAMGYAHLNHRSTQTAYNEMQDRFNRVLPTIIDELQQNQRELRQAVHQLELAQRAAAPAVLQCEPPTAASQPQIQRPAPVAITRMPRAHTPSFKLKIQDRL